MSEVEGTGSTHEEKSTAKTSTATYLLRPLVQDIQLSPEEHTEQAHITCVELCGELETMLDPSEAQSAEQTSDENLYIGTSQAEILHFVSIPPDPGDESQAPSYIFASRLRPAYNTQAAPQPLPGVQQILILSKVQKACILCNGTLSFYSLPELSPAFTTVAHCTWVGGVDLNSGDGTEENGVVVMICVKNRVRLVRIRDEARRVKDIEFPGCLVSTRRGNFACVADAHSYALLDVENQQKISLFPISSLDENDASGKVEDISTSAASTHTRNSSSSRPLSSEGSNNGKGHGRNTSLGAFVGGLGRRQGSPQSRSRDRSGLTTPEPFPREASPAPSPSNARIESNPESPAHEPLTPQKPLPPPPRTDSLRPPAKRYVGTLRPHISSPTPKEFLLVTGTAAEEAGVGIFVNLDGDVVRGTLQFSRYPQSVVVDGRGTDSESFQAMSNEEREGFILATMKQPDGAEIIEIQRWDIEDAGTKERMRVPGGFSSDFLEQSVRSSHHPCGLRTVDTVANVNFPEVGELIRSRRLRLPKAFKKQMGEESGVQKPLEDWEENRNQEEADFGRRLGGRTCRNMLWSGSSIWWVVRNPLAMKLDAAISEAVGDLGNIDRSNIIRVVNSIRGQEATTETEFLSLEYIRQKISLILFADLFVQPNAGRSLPSADLRITEGLLIEGALDPRSILSLIPKLREEVVEGERGIWIHAGLVPIIEAYWPRAESMAVDLSNPQVLGQLKRYLGAWRQRKGFGSIADETEVFQTVDAALLRILLIQDTGVTSRPSKPSPEKIELYALVDSGVDCFDRAIELLDQYYYLFVLSRLFQSRRMARKVLETWRRIVEGDHDEGGGLVDGENEIRKYLVNIKDTALVDEYGTWLARRNPALGVRVFTNDSGRVKWEPHQVIMLLQRRAPDAVKDYLEHLVFGKKNVKYANDLISYYLDSVLTVLGNSEDARAILAQSYQAYRALHPPKPTYRQFIMDNAAPQRWWHDRLRLLELIGGSHGSDFSYDVSQVLTRIGPFEEALVPESIILDGRQGRHKEALRLLTHGLGDYHTAVNYCLLGGASIFHPAQGSVAPIAAPSQEEQAVLFGYLLTEFLRIEDSNDRLERTSELLERFSSWYDVNDVLNLIPESWSVELVSGFLVSAFRSLVHDKNEAMITKALSGAENLQVASAFIEKCIAIGPRIETAEVS